MVQNQPFEMPKQLRELAENNVEQARAAYAQFMDAMTQALSMWSTAPSNAMTAGFRDIQELAIRFAKENAEAGFTLASDLANAKDIQGVLSLQSRYAATPRRRCSLMHVRPRSLAGSWQMQCRA
jgi:hypothetical protein